LERKRPPTQLKPIIRVNSRLLKFLLIAAIATPCAYFGAQAAAAPFYPDYSVLTVSASDLGSDRSSRPAILNGCAILTGELALLGSIGLALALPKIGASKVAAWLLAACVASTGSAAFWAGLHPLPSSLHDPGALGAGMFAAPFLSAFVAWRVERLRSLRWVLLMNVVAFGACAWVLSGAAGVNLAAYGGFAQKCAAVVCFVPPALIAWATLIAMRKLNTRVV
jgi:hypothetical membrane protein